MPTLKPDISRDRYAEFGRSALIPGVQHAIAILEEHLAQLRGELAGLQNGAQPPTVKLAKRVAAGRSGWSDDPAERRAEMQRRIAKRRQKSDKGRAKMSKASKATWAALTPRQRKQRIANI